MGKSKWNDQSSEPSFSIDGFKKWIENHEPLLRQAYPPRKGIGDEVEPKFSIKKTEPRMIIESGEMDSLLRDFYSSGGRVVEIYDNRVLIEVASGSFGLPRIYVVKKN